MINGRCVTSETEGPGRREAGNDGARMTGIACDVRANRPSVRGRYRVGPVTGGTCAVGFMVLLVTTGAGGGGVHRRHAHRGDMTRFTGQLAVPPVRKGHRARTRSTTFHLDHEAGGQRVGQAGALVTLDAPLTGPHLVMADLTAAGRLEGEPLAGSAEVADQTGHCGVAAVREGVDRHRQGRRGAGSLARDARRAHQAQSDHPDEQAPAATGPPGPGFERGKEAHRIPCSYLADSEPVRDALITARSVSRDIRREPVRSAVSIRLRTSGGGAGSNVG